MLQYTVFATKNEEPTLADETKDRRHEEKNPPPPRLDHVLDEASFRVSDLRIYRSKPHDQQGHPWQEPEVALGGASTCSKHMVQSWRALCFLQRLLQGATITKLSCRCFTLPYPRMRGPSMQLSLNDLSMRILIAWKLDDGSTGSEKPHLAP